MLPGCARSAKARGCCQTHELFGLVTVTCGILIPQQSPISSNVCACHELSEDDTHIYYLKTTNKHAEGGLREPSPPARQGQAAPQRSTWLPDHHLRPEALARSVTYRQQLAKERGMALSTPTASIFAPPPFVRGLLQNAWVKVRPGLAGPCL